MAVEKRSPSRSKGKANEQLETSTASSSQVAARADANSTKQGTKMSDQVSIIEYTEDLEAAEAPPVLPAGDYTAEIRGAEIKNSAKGNQYVQVTFFISPDEYPADSTDLDADGTILSYGRLSPENTVKARHTMKKFVSAIGGTLGKSLDLSEWIGKTAVVQVVNEPYDGQMQANIKKVIAA